MIQEAGPIGYMLALGAYLVLGVIYVFWGSWARQGYVFLLATFATAVWAGVASLAPWSTLAEFFHHVTSLTWLFFLWMLIALSPDLKVNYPRWIRLGWAILGGLGALVLLLDIPRLFIAGLPDWPVIGFALLVSVAGLSLTETVFRTTQRGQIWGLKYLCLAVGGMFAYDVFLFSEALLYRAVDPTLLSVRGFVVAFLVPLFVLNIFRAKARHLALAVSTKMVFGSTVVLGVGIYLALMALAAVYIRDFGGTWSSALQIIFVFCAILALFAALLSGTFRSYIRRFLAEHFQKQKFDYRHEWRRLLQRISSGDDTDPLDLRVVKTLADMLDCPGGALWYLEEGNFALATTWNTPASSIAGTEAERLAAGLQADIAIIELKARKSDVKVPSEIWLVRALAEIPDGCFLLPLRHHDSLIGLILLTEPRVSRTLDHDDRELVALASRQAAGYLSEQRTARALAEAREFERFNQRYAFVAHDIKNLVSQLSLMLRNAEKHGSRPEFQEDMLETVQSAVGRMNHLMERLKDDPDAGAVEAVAVKPMIEKLRDEQQLNGTEVRIECPASLAGLKVRADTRRVEAILRHLYQNALEAAGQDGSIVIGLRRDKNFAVIEVRDSGQGMDLEFIRDELFRPFRSTKRGGMGIGAFQCRAYARELGGDLEAISSVGAGTTMRVTLPILRAPSRAP